MDRRIRNIHFRILFLALFALLGLASAGSAHTDVISAQISRLADALGMTRETHDLYRGWLDEDASKSVTYRLSAGVRYRLIGACDEDCDDLDFDLFDASGILVDKDRESDDTPVVTVRPTYTQTYRLRVKMYSCSIEPCEFGIGVYRN